MPDMDMRTPPSKREQKREAADYQKRGATAKKRSMPTDYRGKTMVQPDGSHKNTPIPKHMRHAKARSKKKR